jgi:acyl-CoA reductase-like NAD-dependent aldehyde dehydrogenase
MNATQNPDIISINPATGEEIGRVQTASAEDVRGAVERSRAAFTGWKETPFAERRRLVMAAREVIIAEQDDIASLISRESGKPVAEAFSMEIAPVLDLMQHFARNTELLLKPRKISIGIYGLLGRASKVIYKPMGVVAIIPAWNYPFSIPLGEAVMAVMAGNTVVIKPSELTPFIGLKIGKIFERAGFPNDVVQIVTGAGETGAALVDAPPDKIMFTGSVATGKKIAEVAARNLTSVVLELGGKDPMIVFDDANLDLAASAAVWGAFCNAGQSCSSVERLYVQRSVADKLTEKIIARTKQLKVGPGDDPDVSVAAMSSARQLKTVHDHVEEFRDSGATVQTGGHVIVPGFTEPAEKVETANGFFYPPTIITGATNDMRPMQDETFGPTLPICIFDTEAEAVALANDSEFGLTASVWTRDYAKGRRVAERIDAGTVCINEVLYTHGIAQTPWGGFKNSGLGRTHGTEGLMELVQPQHIHTNQIAQMPNAWWMPYTQHALETFRKMTTTFSTGSVSKTSGLLPQLMSRISEIRRATKGK